ncbi:AT-rich interactive domain-containing protein 2 [Linum perenne]
MVQKRSICEDEFYNLSCKHPKHFDHNEQLVSFSELAPLDVSSLYPSTSGEHGTTESNSGSDGGAGCSSDSARTPLTTNQDLGNDNPWSGHSYWAISSTDEEAFHWDPPVDVSSPPDYISPDCTISSHYQDTSWSPCPQKTVPIGPNHQADIPECEVEAFDKVSTIASMTKVVSVGSLSVRGVDVDNGPTGTCVIPMPEVKVGEELGVFSNECSCHDEGSIRCVRQHIVEARDRLRKNLGEDKFAELGFCDMGEHVAQRWSEMEEQMFHDVVFSNPISIGRNFWKSLSMVFSSRTSEELVCYYYNVFMLRKRAEQNRSIQMNIDSDNDEWEGVDESLTPEEEEDLVVESPECPDNSTPYKSLKVDTHVPDEGVAADNKKICFDNIGEVDDFPHLFYGDYVSYSKPSPSRESNYKEVHEDSWKSV